MNMKITDGRVRPVRENDLEQVLYWRNLPKVRQYMFTDNLITMEEHQRWFSTLDPAKRLSLMFELDDKPVGVVNINDIDRDHRKCSWGFYLGEQGLPKGTGLLMGYHGLQYIFTEVKIRKLNSMVFAFNTRSIRYHQRLGFATEGLMKREWLKNGRYEDVVLMAIFREDWQQHQREVEKAILAY